MDDVKQQVAEKLKQANNILVTVKTDPSIDLLAACIGLSLVLDKIGKHATAVFSGEVPSAMEFLKPEETLEESPNSLRDFIISLDKSKADKLRYKVEDKVVRIFITPFKAGLSEADLEFSQGDFNIDLLVALGVHEQGELDAAVTAHGRILHDASVISINTTPNGNLGTLNWVGTSVSSVSEMIASLARLLDVDVYDEQIATALLTGIVAETARFSNDKTSPQTMAVAGELMAAGANQQLVATELQGSIAVGAPGSVKADIKPSEDNGTLEIEHTEPPEPIETPSPEVPKLESEPQPEAAPQPTVDESPKPEESPLASDKIDHSKRTILPMPDPGKAGDSAVSDVASSSFTGGFSDEDRAGASSSYLIDKASEIKGGATGSSSAQPPATDLPPITVATPSPATDAQAPAAPLPTPDPLAPAPSAKPTTPPADDKPQDQTLQDIESSVKGTVAPAPPTDSSVPTAAATDSNGVRVDDARQQVLDALKQGPQPLEPLAALNAHPLGTPLVHDDAAAASSTTPSPSAEPAQPAAIEVDNEGNLTTLPLEPAQPAPAPNAPSAMDMPLPPVAPGAPPVSTDQPVSPSTSTAPPPVPPPMMPPNFGA